LEDNLLALWNILDARASWLQAESTPGAGVTFFRHTLPNLPQATKPGQSIVVDRNRVGLEDVTDAPWP
jgi:hypothetical protein